ncbi:MAG TPA: hypothetical protein VER17_11835 [Tepidisphaeraceae bacterium]|nr:hypothetical protein [Tepidisphaeraceae bacterium]
MGVRETIEQHKAWAAGIAVVVVIAAAALAWRASNSSAGGERAVAAQQAFYSVDDGANFFTAAADQIPPFDYNGKPAVRAIVFACDGKNFVGYLEQYGPAARAALQAVRDAAQRGDKQVAPAGPVAGDVEIKKPGASGKWVSRRSPGAAEILNVTCPGGGGGTPTPVAP